MKLIKKSLFNSVLSEDGYVLPIDKNDINEFSVGKNYFYAIQNKNNILNTHDNLIKILNTIETNNSAVAFKKGNSYYSFLEPHKENYNFLRLDIRSYFHSLRIEDIINILEPYVEDSYLGKKENQKTMHALLNLITYTIPQNSNNSKFVNKTVLPMGFKTSPVISNIIFRKLDIQIQKLCQEHNITYSRYADDLLFSSKKGLNFIHQETFIEHIKIIIYQLKLQLNTHKTIKAKNTISLNGYIIQYSKRVPLFYDEVKGDDTPVDKNNIEHIINEIRLSNKKIQIIKKLLHHLKKGEPSWKILKNLFNYKINYVVFPSHTTLADYYNLQLQNKIKGYRAFLLSIVQFSKQKSTTTNKTIDKYIELINRLEQYI